MPKVFKFRKYAPTHDDYVTASRIATKKKIKELGAELSPAPKRRSSHRLKQVRPSSLMPTI
jgi:hypothetical protein